MRLYGKIYIIADTHGTNIKFESKPEDLLIHLGDYETGKIETAAKKIIIRGDHDMLPLDEFDFACDGLLINHYWLTHEPAFTLPLGAKRNIFGHIHTGRINEFGYQEKEWHYWLPPNEIHELDKFIFEAKERIELSRIRNKA